MSISKIEKLMINNIRSAIDIEKIINKFNNIGINVEPQGKDTIGWYLYDVQTKAYDSILVYLYGEDALEDDLIYDKLITFIESSYNNNNLTDEEILNFLNSLKS